MTMNNPAITRALVYCRVSSERQKSEGHGLDAQEHRSREYAKSKGYEVEEVFKDAFTGGGDFMQRPAMAEMLAYIDSKPHRKYVVIFDDISRLARDVVAHIKLRAAFSVRGVVPLCTNYNFDETPEGGYVELIFAGKAELDRKQNRRQVIQKQTARLQLGYWPFYPPPGYKQVKDPVHGKLLTPSGPRASLIREALEGFASDRFFSQADVMRFLNASGYSKYPITQEYVRRLLRRVVYAGYVERREWDVTRRKGQHEALISLETFEKNQAKLDGNGRMKVRKSDKLDFVLRGFLLCAFCNKPMTANWSTGRNKKYRYYRCKTLSCDRKGKSIDGNFIDKEFNALLRSAAPKPAAVQLAKAIVIDLWATKVKDFEGRQKRIEGELAQVRTQIETLLERVVRAVDEKVVGAYEAQIAKYQSDGEMLQQKLKTLGETSVSFETALEVVLEILKNPLIIWNNQNIDAKRLVLRLVFAEKLAFHPKFGFETAQKSLLIGLFEQISANNSQDVEMARIERACNKGPLVGLRGVDRFSVLALLRVKRTKSQ